MSDIELSTDVRSSSEMFGELTGERLALRLVRRLLFEETTGAVLAVVRLRLPLRRLHGAELLLNVVVRISPHVNVVVASLCRIGMGSKVRGLVLAVSVWL